MTLKTAEWAIGLRDSLQAEIDLLVASPVKTSKDLERVVGLRAQLKQAEALLAALKEIAKPGGVDR